MSTTFNLNDESFDSGASSIFNNGIAGVVENCKVRLERTKQADKDNPNSPDYKLFFTDTTGADLNLGLWYPKDNEEEKNIIKFLKKLKHLAHCFCGDTAQLPSGSPKVILDGVMKMLKDSGLQMPVKVMTNYGTNGYEKMYLNVRSFVPFVEPMTVLKEESRLRKSNIENFERPAAEETSGGVTADSTTDEDWD
jgi:hypothetical protein